MGMAHRWGNSYPNEITSTHNELRDSCGAQPPHESLNSLGRILIYEKQKH